MKEVRHAAVRLLAMREHSRKELERKLARRYAPAVVSQIVDELAEQGLQSDERFTEQYGHSRRNKGYGPVRIQMELAERGVADELISSWLDEIAGEDWQQLMHQVAERKFGASPADDRREMARRGRFLASRGFPSWMINEYIFG
ncbi:regulatory protein RecX [Thiolapillus brandeum]|uniref:Regulatory protein RecX n=1 Tax=Thiolapillus brandeum TaxID=1076588 RepID=A0A7U6GJN4_9GAMM|nr:regulatory protein RecX [Thiolapillus brandeum]BAO44852.1 regulatory protein RecX [Thiolapillus brandeum]